MTEFGTYKTEFATHYAELETYHADNLTKKKSTEEPQEEEEVKAVDVDNLKGKQGIPDFWFRSIKNNQMIFVAVPAGAAGDAYAITREVVRRLPSALEMDESGLRSGIERISTR